MGLLDLVRPRRKPRARQRFHFVPVIFANGVDDDLFGLDAAVLNETVQFEERIYQPGEALKIVGKDLRFNCDTLFLLGADTPWPEQATARDCVIREATVSRSILIFACRFHMGRIDHGGRS